jgi:hypothetical protein
MYFENKDRSAMNEDLFAFGIMDAFSEKGPNLETIIYQILLI